MTSCPVCHSSWVRTDRFGFPTCQCGRSIRKGEHFVVELHLGGVTVPTPQEVDSAWIAKTQSPSFPKECATPEMKRKLVPMLVERMTRDSTHGHLTFVHWAHSNKMWRINGPYTSFDSSWVDVSSQDWQHELENRVRLLQIEEIMD